MLVVLGAVSALTGMVTIGLRGFQREQGAAIVEVKGFLESARSLAVARRTEVYVAFTNGEPEDDEHKFSRMAMFIPDPNLDLSSPEIAVQQRHIFERKIVPVSEWFRLPAGQTWAFGKDFEQPLQGAFQTLLDLESEENALLREFPFRLENDTLKLPFLMFDGQGRVGIPPIFAQQYLNVGIVSRFYENGDPVDQGQQTGTTGDQFPRTRCVGINPLTGRAHILNY
tara:strand:+ start:16975 stop:17652 length:678 start_codon:yes stop_codon:yes gene_type:complete